MTLGSYRAFYILNWILRLGIEGHFDPIAVIFGIIQTALYIDFAWVYWTRQRVKLRNGGVVDSEDLSRGWLVSRVLGQDRDSFDEENVHTENAATNGTRKASGGGWGARGMSVSADEQVLDRQHKANAAYADHSRARDEEVGDVLDNNGAQQAHDGSPTGTQIKGNDANGLSDGHEWRDESK